MSEPLTVREYAMKEGVPLGTVYRRIWEGQVAARQMYAGNGLAMGRFWSNKKDWSSSRAGMPAIFLGKLICLSSCLRELAPGTSDDKTACTQVSDHAFIWSFTAGGSMRRKFAGGDTTPDHYQ